jgi:hypothetical protein
LRRKKDRCCSSEMILLKAKGFDGRGTIKKPASELAG